ncbi:MAG: hypothetical protein SO253_00260 [Bacilli bacterium]|nr:hypothetical protein [Bacilli bacterium]
MEWTLFVIFIITIIPILIGARFRAKKDVKPYYFSLGNSIQVGAILAACVLITADFLHPSYGYLPFYIALGISALIYVGTLIYIKVKVIQK